MSPVAAPSDRRFRRAHVKPGRKRGRLFAVIRPVLKIAALAVLALYALYRGGSVVTHARVLQIGDVVIHGNGRLSTGDVMAVLDAVDDGSELAAHPAVQACAEDLGDLVGGQSPQAELAAPFEQLVDRVGA